MQLPSLLLLASATVIAALGLAHLVFTFVGRRFEPREPGLMAQMQAAHPVITRQTTMWRAWIGFNASHSVGALLFGLVYGYLALQQPALLWASPFLLGVGLAVLLGYTALGWLYWFSVPFRGIVLALALYAAALAAVAARA